MEQLGFCYQSEDDNDNLQKSKVLATNLNLISQILSSSPKHPCYVKTQGGSTGSNPTSFKVIKIGTNTTQSC